MILFRDDLIPEYVEWKRANPNTFEWWSYVNLKSDLQTALGFAKFFYPAIVEIDGCFILEDQFSQEGYNGWKTECESLTCIEKMMNLYEVKDFFHHNTEDDGKLEEQIHVLGEVLKKFWTMSFNDRFPDKKINVKLFCEYDELFITVFQERE